MSTVVEVVLFPGHEIKPNRKEALRYLGVKDSDPQLSALLCDCEKELAAAAACRVVYTYLPLTQQGDTLYLGTYEVKSHALSKNLSGCGTVCLFAATIGVETDRLIAKYGRVFPAKGVIIDAVASSMVEGLCDAFDRRVGEAYVTCPRFSPGYGDFPLTAQKELLSLLDAYRKIGVTATAAEMLVPTKSVTAVIGIRGSRA